MIRFTSKSYRINASTIKYLLYECNVKEFSNRVFRFSGRFMEVELVHVLMSSISSLSIREIRLTSTGK